MLKWKRPAAFLLAAAMIFTMPGIPVFAMETDTSAVHKGLCDHTSGFTDGVATAASGTATYTTDFAALVTTADGTQAYGSFDEAWNKAIASEGSTLKLLSDVTLPAVNDGLSVSEGSFTLDLNNKTLDGGIWNQLLEVSGTANITIKNGSLVNTQTGGSGSATQTNLIALEISGGTVALENVNLTSGIIDNDEYAYALYITGGSLTVNGSTFTGEVRVLCENSSTRPALSIKDAALNNGIFYGVWGTKESDAAGLKAIFADGSMLFDQNSKYIDLTKEDYWMIEPEGACFLYTEKCIVKPHTHEVVDGVCECGAAFSASVTQNGAVTYYKDFDAALAAANAGDTLTLLKDVTGGFTVTIDKAITLDLNGHEISFLKVQDKAIIRDSSGGKGKISETLTVENGLTIGDLLEEGYAFRKVDANEWYNGTDVAVGNATVQQVPITSVALTALNADDAETLTTMPYGTTGGIKLSASCTTPGAGESSAGEPSCQWYTVGGNLWPIDGETGTEYNLPADLSVGTYRYLVTFTADGYSMSKEITITVTPTTIPVVTAPVANTLTYNGAEQALVTAGSAANHGTMQYSLTENGTYSQDIPTGIDAGTYTVWYRVIGDANHNDTAPASVVVSIGKKPLTITGVTAASKSYDGTTNADISSVTFDGVTLKRGTDYTVTASFDDASVGNGKSITATVTLMEQTAKNYALEQSSFTTTGSITRVAAPDFIRETALVIVNGCEKTYTVTIPTLPTLETPKEYGALTYEIGEIRLNGGYYTSGAKVENGELTLPIQKNDVETTGSVGTATVVIKSTNYEDITLTVNISAENRHIPAVTAPTANALTYNGAKQALVTAGKTTGGTMQYSLTENGTYSQNIPTGTDAGTYTVWYRVIGDANHNDTAPASVVVSIGKKPLTITGVTAASKSYDGTTNADISSVTFDGVTLNRGTDYTVTASFDDASVGNGKNITATVTLMEQAAKNYALEQSSFTTTGNITKAAAPDFTKETALTIINDCEKTYTVTLPALPTLETPKEYGALTYELGEIKLNDGYYTGGAKAENGKLTLPIQKNDVKTTGNVGTATVVIKSTNYNDIILTVNISAENKRIPAVTAPTANALTYNGAKQALVTAGKTTGGTMLYRLGDSKWSEQIPTAKNAGKYTVWYKVQGNAEYADMAEQSLTVTIAKKAVTVTALDKSAYTGSTAPDLSSPEADKDYKMEGLVGADTLSGTVILTYEQTPDMSKTGKTVINITGRLSNDNYEITYIPGTLTVTDGDEPAPKPTPEPTPNPTPVDQNVQKAQENVKRLLAQADELLRAGQGSYDDASWRAFTAAYEAAKKGGNDVASLQKLADALTAAQSNLTLKNGTAVTDATGVFTYKVTGADTVEVTGITEKGKKKAAVKISSTMKGNGKTYKITSVAANALKGNKKMTSLTIGNNVVTIGKNAFANCTKLKKVTVNGNKLKTIGKNAFSGDKKLKTINMKKVKSLKTVGKSAFKGISKKVTVKVPGAKKAAYKRLFKKGGIAANRIK